MCCLVIVNLNVKNTKGAYTVKLSNLNKKILSQWVVRYRANNVSQPWTTLDKYDKKVSAIIKAYQVSGKYFMVKVIGPDGSIVWSD